MDIKKLVEAWAAFQKFTMSEFNTHEKKLEKHEKRLEAIEEKLKRKKKS